MDKKIEIGAEEKLREPHTNTLHSDTPKRKREENPMTKTTPAPTTVHIPNILLH